MRGASSPGEAAAPSLGSVWPPGKTGEAPPKGSPRRTILLLPGNRKRLPWRPLGPGETCPGEGSKPGGRLPFVQPQGGQTKAMTTRMRMRMSLAQEGRNEEDHLHYGVQISHRHHQERLDGEDPTHGEFVFWQDTLGVLLMGHWHGGSRSKSICINNSTNLFGRKFKDWK